MFRSSLDPAPGAASRSRSDRVARISRSVSPLVQHHRHLHDDLGRHVCGHFHEDGAHHAALEREHEEQPVGPRLQQLQPLEHGLVERRAHRHPQLFREHTEHLRRPFEDLVHGVPLGELFANLVRVGRRHLRQPHQRVHVHAVGEVRGDAAGGGMGVVEVALFLEVAHRVANCGRGERVAELLRNSPAPRRLGGFDVGLDNGLEDLALALVQGPCHVTQALTC